MFLLLTQNPRAILLCPTVVFLSQGYWTWNQMGFSIESTNIHLGFPALIMELVNAG